MKVTPPVAYGFTVALGGPAEPGEFYDVDDELGAQLVAQGWSVPTSKQAKAAEKAAESEAEPTEPDPQADTKKETA